MNTHVIHTSEQARRLFKGSIRSYPQAVRLGVIDPRIRDLVAAMNVDGVLWTRSSCQGHGWPRMFAPPFVMFGSPMALASALSIRLEDMAWHRLPLLYHYWTVTGIFNEGEMFFRLSLGENPRDLWPVVRQRFDADFDRLKVLVNQQVAHAIRSEPSLPDTFDRNGCGSGKFISCPSPSLP